MTEAQYHLFLTFAAAVAAAGAILNLLRLKKRGNSALLLAAAFVVLGVLLWLVKLNANQTLIGLAGALLVGLLIGDIVVRSKRQDATR